MAKDLAYSTKDLAYSTKDLAYSTKGRILATLRHSSNKPSPSSNKPGPSSNKPSPSSNKPSPSSNKPSPSSNKPSPSSNKPSPSSNKASPSSIKSFVDLGKWVKWVWCEGASPGFHKILLGSNVKGSGISISEILFFFLVFYCFCFVWVPGRASRASLSFWEPRGVQKTILGYNVKGSGISISVIFFIFLGVLLFLFRLGAWGSFWGPP